jgi:hypothetical protein
MDLLAARLPITRDHPPILWDADFILCEVLDQGQRRYVLCKINVSSVAPHPDSANAAIVEAVRSLPLAAQANCRWSPAGAEAAGR